MKHTPKWWFTALTVAGLVFVIMARFVWSAPPQKTAGHGKSPAAANVKKQNMVQTAPVTAKKPLITKATAKSHRVHRRFRHPRRIKLAGVVYTPETITGDPDITLPTFPLTRDTRSKFIPYTVAFDKMAEDEEGLGTAEQTDDYPTSSGSSVVGILFKVRLYFYDVSTGKTTGVVDHKGYKITGLNGVQEGHTTADFDLRFTKKFKFPNPGQTSATILVEIQRLNPDNPPPDYAKYKGKRITVHAP